MNAFIAIILGLVQGLCEFLPISSSGHLLLLQKIFGISDGGLFFTVMLHLGTLAAVLVVYRKRIIEMLLHPVKQAKYWIWMIVATLVTAVMALVFKDVIDAANEGSLLGFCFLFTAALLVLCDFIRQKVECKLTVPSMKWYHAVFIGFVQGVAILPGISRSGSTITGATLCSMKKEDAAEFSFLLSIPAILGGAVLEIPGAVSAGAANINWLSVVLGVAAAAVSGYFAVRFMIKLITKHSLWGFAIYTAILGAFIVLDQIFCTLSLGKSAAQTLHFLQKGSKKWIAHKLRKTFARCPLQLPGLQFSETNCSLVPSENFPSFFALPISATCKTLRTHFPL